MSTPKFLIIYSAYNQEEYIEKSLTPFLETYGCYVTAVSHQFKEFGQPRKDNTVDILKYLKQRYNRFISLDHSDDPVDKEHMSKNIALNKSIEYIKSLPIDERFTFDYIWIVDSDEFYTTEQINNIIEYIKTNGEREIWFSINLKNFVFDKETYLEQPFNPPRIFRTSFEIDWRTPAGEYFLHSFYWDNDVAYARVKDWQTLPKAPLYSFNSFSECIIPQDVAWIDHYCWLNDERSKQKVEYQKKHFGQCSYDWDEIQGLIFDEEYYKKHNMIKPNLKKIRQ